MNKKDFIDRVSANAGIEISKKDFEQWYPGLKTDDSRVEAAPRAA